MRFGEFFRFSNKKFLLLFFFLLFFVFFRFQPIPFNGDDFGYLTTYKTVFPGPITAETLDELSQLNVLPRPFALLIFFPIIFLFGFGPYVLVYAMHFSAVGITLAMLYLNFKLFSKRYGFNTGALSTFLLATTYTTSYVIGYIGTLNITLSAVYWLAFLLLLNSFSKTKNLLIASLLVAVALFTREAIGVAFLAVIVFLLFVDLINFTQKKPGAISSFMGLAKKYAILFLPFIVFWAFLTIFFGGIGGFQQGMMEENFFLAAKDFFLPPNESGILYYATYFTQNYLAPIFLFAFALLAFSFLRSPSFTFPSVGSFINRHLFSLVLLASLAGMAVPIFLNSHEAFRYLAPVLPIIFVFFSKIFSDHLLSKLDSMPLKLLALGFFLNLVFWILFFNAWIFSPEAATLLLNIFFFFILAFSFSPIFFALLKGLPRKQRLLNSALAVLLVLLSVSVVAQVNEVYGGFYSVHYTNSKLAFDSGLFIASSFPENSRVFTVQAHPWFWWGSMKALGREDTIIVHRVPEPSELNQKDFLIQNSIDGGNSIQKFVDENPEKFRELKSFGEEYRFHPRSTLSVKMLSEKLLLFEFFRDRSPEIILFEVR